MIYLVTKRSDEDRRIRSILYAINGLPYEETGTTNSSYTYSFSIDEHIEDRFEPIRCITSGKTEVALILEQITGEELHKILSAYIKDGVAEAGDIGTMTNLFSWGASEEGFDYWRRIYHKLINSGL